MSFVFLSMDDPKAKKAIVDFLLAEKIPLSTSEWTCRSIGMWP